MLVATSKNKLNRIYENMDYLFNEEKNEVVLEQYINRLFDEKTKYKEELLEKLTVFIREKDYMLAICPDRYELYQFFRNTINDFNKEMYYDLIYIFIINNYNCLMCASEKQRVENYPILFLQAFEKSSLTKVERELLKKRTIRNTLDCTYNDQKLNIKEERYQKSYKYLFTLLKFIIDENDIELYKEFISKNRYFDRCDLLLDLFMTNEIYFYYLIEVETKNYVSEDEKYVYKEMKSLLNTIFRFEMTLYMDHYYIDFQEFIKSLKSISQWWDRMNYDEVKRCVAPATIEYAAKGLYIIFGREHFAADNIINVDVIELFKNDFRKGKIKVECSGQLKL